MEPADLTVEILRGIREELHQLSGRVDGLSRRTDDTRAELSGRIDTLSARVVASEIRTATAITELAGTMREMTSVLRVQGELRPRVERCERDIDELRERLARG